MPENEILRVYDITTKVSPEVDADATVVSVSEEQLQQIAATFKPTYYMAIVFDKEKLCKKPLCATTPQPTYDQILRTILTPEQYEQTLKANQAGKTVKFAKSS